ncbi:MAG: hypothetical protein K2H12_08315 [Acetatifactor sp.]|nr:hypothetical protein [Acetatifactor sp.]
MKAGKIYYDLNPDIDKMGMVLYSESAVQDLVEGEKFFQRDHLAIRQREFAC